MEEYSHMIVWLDQNITSPGYGKQLKKAFATTTNPASTIATNIDERDISNLIRDNSEYGQTSFLDVPFTFRLFCEVEPCLGFLLSNTERKRIFFLTSGSLGELIIPRILPNHKQIFEDENGKIYEDSIYIFCADMAKHKEWATEYLEFGCIKMDNNDQTILARLTRDIAKYLLSEGKKLVNDNNDLISLEKSLKYFHWSKQLYDKAQTINKTDTTHSILKNIDQIINNVESQIKQLHNDDEDKIGEQN